MTEHSQPIKTQRAYRRRAPPELHPIVAALGLQAKNLYNTTLFVMRQVLTAFEQADEDGNTWRAKAKLHENQQFALDAFAVATAKINADRTSAHPAKVAKVLAEGKAASELKLVPALCGDTVWQVVLDSTVLDNVLRVWTGANGVTVYRRLPAKMAQQVIFSVIDAWKSWFGALKVWKPAADGKGRPAMPDYLGKRSTYVIELPLTQAGRCLPNLGLRTIPANYEETVFLGPEDFEAWNTFDLAGMVNALAGRHGGAKRHLRIHAGAKPVFEFIFQHTLEIPEDSLLMRLRQAFGPDKWDKLTPGKLNEHLLKALPEHDGLRVAGGDLGMNQFITLSYSTGHKADVVTGGRIDVMLRKLNAKVDAVKSRLMAPELRALQEKLQDRTASVSDKRTFKQGIKALYGHPDYLKTKHDRDHWLDDALHKLSHNLVQRCSARAIDVLVVGLNPGWKDKSDMGAQQNRRFLDQAHSRFLNLLRYKAQAAGIVLVTTEESYTSKTSFVTNAELISRENAEQQTRRHDKTITDRHRFGGRRLRKERRAFESDTKSGIVRVHGDVNGAYNIIRKVFMRFSYTPKLSLNYVLLRLSPRLGLTPVMLR